MTTAIVVVITNNVEESGYIVENREREQEQEGGGAGGGNKQIYLCMYIYIKTWYMKMNIQITWYSNEREKIYRKGEGRGEKFASFI